jgi:hypothetical protein
VNEDADDAAVRVEERRAHRGRCLLKVDIERAGEVVSRLSADVERAP